MGRWWGGFGSGGGGSEPGVDCLIDEMQDLVNNGWKHLQWTLSHLNIAL